MHAKFSLATILLTSSFIAVGLSACDKGAQPAAPADATPATPAAADSVAATPAQDDTEPGAPGVKWADKSFKQRQEYMGITFLKAQKKSFKAHDEAAFSGFKCQTCHGDDMKETNFAMPTDSLLPLDAKDPVGVAMEFDEEITKFMVEQIVPEAAQLLDMEPYNPETGQGFGCFGCHPTE
ncbi:MAG: hypothetical protein KUG77_16200 [Nannocystaceae bacterium]|nr:hypothetical protein [Nannocystaceae bacterium]